MIVLEDGPAEVGTDTSPPSPPPAGPVIVAGEQPSEQAPVTEPPVTGAPVMEGPVTEARVAGAPICHPSYRPGVSQHGDSSAAVAGPRLCPTCQRPLVAQDRGEYTQQRAALVAARGLCVCAIG